MNSRRARRVGRGVADGGYVAGKSEHDLQGEQRVAGFAITVAALEPQVRRQLEHNNEENFTRARSRQAFGAGRVCLPLFLHLARAWLRPRPSFLTREGNENPSPTFADPLRKGAGLFLPGGPNGSVQSVCSFVYCRDEPHSGAALHFWIPSFVRQHVLDGAICRDQFLQWRYIHVYP